MDENILSDDSEFMYPGDNGKERSLWRQSWQQFKHSKLGMTGLVIVAILFVISIGTVVFDIVTDGQFYDDHVISQNLSNKLNPPSKDHIFGCDEFGRDIFYRMVWGTRLSVTIGVAAVLGALALGGPLGAIAGFYGGRTDDIIMRVMDVFLAMPSMLLAMAIVAAFGVSIPNLLIAMSLSNLARYARVTRAAVLTVKGQEFVEAARAVGAGDLGIIFKYIIPNTLSPILVQSTLGIGSSILSLAGMSYIGLGIQPPTPEWGAILTSAKTYMRDAWHISVFPGLALVITVLAFNLLGDGLRDALDPKLKK